LKILSTEATMPNSPLQRRSANYRDYSTLLNNSTAIVTQLNDIIVKFQNLGQSRRSNWNRLRFANRNLGKMRSKLTSHISLLSAFLDTINVSALGRIERDLGVFPEMMNAIHKLAAETRAGKREGSVMTAYGDDDPGIWREFRRELIKEGYSSDSIRKYRTQLKGHLRALHADGLLDEEAPQIGRWLAHVSILPAICACVLVRLMTRAAHQDQMKQSHREKNSCLYHQPLMSK
jgi:hypothetical protein